MYRTVVLLIALTLGLTVSCTQSPTVTQVKSASRSCPEADLLFEKAKTLVDSAAQYTVMFALLDSAARQSEICRDTVLYFEIIMEKAFNLFFSKDKTGSINALALLENEYNRFRMDSTIEMGRFCAFMAFLYMTKEDYLNAKKFYEIALAIQNVTNKSVAKNSGRNLYSPIGVLYTQIGEYEKAIQILKAGLDTCFIQFDTIGIGSVCNNLGIAYSSILNTDSARYYFNYGVNVLDRFSGKQTTGVTKKRSYLLGSLSEINLKKGNLKETFLLAIQALKCDPLSPSALTTLAEYYLLQNRPDSARYYFDLLENSHEPSHEPIGSRLNRELGKLIRRRSEVEWAANPRQAPERLLNRCNDAIRTVIPAFQPASPYALPKPAQFYPENTILEALAFKSQILWQAWQQHPEKTQWLALADTTTMLALQMADTLMAEYGFESSKLFSINDARVLYEQLLNILFARADLSPSSDYAARILAVSEKSRALLLREKLASTAALLSSEINPADRQREQELRREIIYRKNRQAELESAEAPPTEIEQNRRALVNTINEHAGVLKKMRQQCPGCFETAMAEPDHAQIQAMLRASGSLLVEYFYNPASGNLYLIGLDGERLIRHKTNLAETDVLAYIAAFTDENTGVNQEGDTAYIQSFIRQSAGLYDKLLRPLTAGRTFRSLIIVPDGVLGSLPFDLLLRERPAPGAGFNNMPYLITESSIRYLPSAAFLSNRARPLRAQALYGGFAPSYVGSGLFAEVRHGRSCVRGVGKQLHGQVFTGPFAARERFLETAGRFRILHFYGHGKANLKNPELCYLAFSPGQAGFAEAGSRLGSTESGLPPEEVPRAVFAHEIGNMQLPAELAVLSACETGVGPQSGMEGVFSMARAFQSAGCPSAAMTLWPVDDEATAALTDLFFRHLAAGLAKDEALRRAKIDYLAKAPSAAPFYWAGMVLTGDAAPIADIDKGCFVRIGTESLSCVVLCQLIGLLLLAFGLLAAILWRR